MPDLTVTTCDWVPEPPRGFVRDLRVRWALEEAGLPYRVATTPSRDRGAEHFAHQPSGQTRWLTDGEHTIVETGAILFHLGEPSSVPMPTDPHGRSRVVQWLFAALASFGMASVTRNLFRSFPDNGDSWGPRFFDQWVDTRLTHLEPVLARSEWLAERLSVADIAMSDVLRLVDRFDGLAAQPACRACVARATACPPFAKAHADRMAHFAAADRQAPAA